ncbi:unnamed protein product [Closterium sp. NIES-53]
MSHPADVPSLPKGQRSRPAADTLASNGVTGPPAVDQQSGSVNVDNEALKDNISMVTDKLNGVNVSKPGGSGLSVADKAAMDEDGYLDEDSDDEMLINLDKEAASWLRSVVILLIPMMLEKEVSCVIETVKALIKHGWYTDLPDGKKEVVYQPLTNMGQLVTLHWLHAEDLSYTREKAMNPLAIEVMIRDVSAAVEPDMLSSGAPVFIGCSTQLLELILTW